MGGVVTCIGRVGGGLHKTDGSVRSGEGGDEPRRTWLLSRVMACIADELAPTAGGTDSVRTRAPNEVVDGEAGRDDRLGDEDPLFTLTDLVGESDPSYPWLVRCRLAWWICTCSCGGGRLNSGCPPPAKPLASPLNDALPCCLSSTWDVGESQTPPAAFANLMLPPGP